MRLDDTDFDVADSNNDEAPTNIEISYVENVKLSRKMNSINDVKATGKLFASFMCMENDNGKSPVIFIYAMAIHLKNIVTCFY